MKTNRNYCLLTLFAIYPLTEYNSECLLAWLIVLYDTASRSSKYASTCHSGQKIAH